MSSLHYRLIITVCDDGIGWWAAGGQVNNIISLELVLYVQMKNHYILVKIKTI